MSAGQAASIKIPVSMPIPMGVDAKTGKSHARWSPGDLSLVPAPSHVETSRYSKPPVLAVDSGVSDAADLTQAGWGILFASDADPAIKEALLPLIHLRKSQVNDESLFKIFEGTADGVRPKQSAASWAATRGVSLVAPVDPTQGVPFYLLMVGSLDRIPFEFQAQFDLQWAVGRLYFDSVTDYASYAQKVVEYETAAAPTKKKRAALWMPRNPLDLSTPLLAGALGSDFLGQLPGGRPLGKKQGFELNAFIGEGQATKARLSDVLCGKLEGGAPSIVFTGSHGAEWPMQDAAVQRERQGALVTQEWSWGQPLQPDHYFSGADLPDEADLQGAMVFLFACFGSGTPVTDTYFKANDGSPLPLASAPIVASLPQKLLSRGALAVIGHVDRAFSYGFEDAIGTPQPQLLRSPLEYLMQGKRVGVATDPINLQWSALAAQLGVLLSAGADNAPAAALANLYIARDDARNYMVLGDPAVRLRTSEMTGA